MRHQAQIIGGTVITSSAPIGDQAGPARFRCSGSRPPAIRKPEDSRWARGSVVDDSPTGRRQGVAVEGPPPLTALRPAADSAPSPVMSAERPEFTAWDEGRFVTAGLEPPGVTYPEEWGGRGSDRRVLARGGSWPCHLAGKAGSVRSCATTHPEGGRVSAQSCDDGLGTTSSGQVVVPDESGRHRSPGLPTVSDLFQLVWRWDGGMADELCGSNL